MKRFAVAAALAAITASGGAALLAQETRSATLLTTEHWLDWERVSDAQISPDGSRIVYTRQHVNKLEDKWDSELWIVNADGAQNRFLVKGGTPRWSSDGKRLLYQAEGEPKGPQLFVRWVDAEGPATQITHITEAPRNAKWSPDGKSIAFSMFVPATEKWTISMPAEPKGAKWTPAPRVVSTIHYRQDQVGYLEDGYTHLFVVPAEGGTPKQLTNGKWSVGSGELPGRDPAQRRGADRRELGAIDHRLGALGLPVEQHVRRMDEREAAPGVELRQRDELHTHPAFSGSRHEQQRSGGGRHGGSQRRGSRRVLGTEGCLQGIDRRGHR